MDRKDFSIDDILAELGLSGRGEEPSPESWRGKSASDFDIEELLGTPAPAAEAEASRELSPPPETPAQEKGSVTQIIEGIARPEPPRKQEPAAPAPEGEKAPLPVVPPSLFQEEENAEEIRRRRSSEGLLESLEERREPKRPPSDLKRTMVLPPLRDKMAGMKLNIEDKILPDTEQLPVEQLSAEERRLVELQARRRRKIKDFVLASDEEQPPLEQVDDEEEELAPEKEAEQELEDYRSYDDTRAVLRELNRLSASLCMRFVVLLLVGIVSIYLTAASELPLPVPELFSRSGHVLGYLYTQLILGAIAAIAAYPVLSGGFVSLFTLKADSDSVSALAFAGGLVAGIVFSVDYDFLQRGMAQLYLSVGILGLLFNTAGKLLIASRTRRNFKLISGDSEKYGAEIVEDEETASLFTRGTMNDFPVLAVQHKTEFLTDFLKHSYAPDLADTVSRITAPVTLGVAVLLGVAGYFLSGNLASAFAVFSATTCICSPFSTLLFASRPLNRASKSLVQTSAVVLSYESAARFSEVNSVLLDATQLFPEGSVDLAGIKTFANTRIDEAIVHAASLAMHADSILFHMFYDIIAGKTDMLFAVESYIYEDSMGVSGWIGNKRVLLGNRELMQNHSIDLPPVSKEKKYAAGGRSVMYLSVSGELSALFILDMKANPEVKEYLQELEDADVHMMLRTIDSVVSINKLAELFEINPAILKLLPYRLHEDFAEQTAYRQRMSGGVSGNGRFVSFASALLASKRIRGSAMLGASLHIASMVLGLLLMIVFTVLGATAQITPLLLLAYNLLWAVFVVAAQGMKRI